MKQCYFFVWVMTMMTGVATSRAAPLLSCYPFDSNATNIVDAVNSGTLMSGAAITNDRAIGSGALSLDGINDYVDLTVNAYPNATAGRFTGSATFWMNAGPTGNTAVADILGIHQALNDFELAYFYSGSGTAGNLLFWCRPGGIVDYRFTPTSSTTNMSDSIWHQYTVTWNMSTGVSGTGSAEWYFDGTLLKSVTGQGTWTNNPMDPWSTPLTIGRGVDYGYFTGKLDDLAVWSNKLTATEAKAIFNLGNDATLNYNAKDIAALFTIFAGGPGSEGRTSDNKLWQYAAGMTGGGAGALIRNSTALILDGSGNGVRLPPHGTVIEVR